MVPLYSLSISSFYYPFRSWNSFDFEEIILCNWKNDCWQNYWGSGILEDYHLELKNHEPLRRTEVVVNGTIRQDEMDTMHFLCSIFPSSFPFNTQSILNFEAQIRNSSKPVPISFSTNALPHFRLDNYRLKFVINRHGWLKGKVFENQPLSEKTYLLYFNLRSLIPIDAESCSWGINFIFENDKSLNYTDSVSLYFGCNCSTRYISDTLQFIIS